MGGDPHELEPGAHQKALIEGQPDERAHLPWASVMPNSCNHLGGCGVLEIESLNEGEHVRGVRHFPGVFVTPFSDVAKKRGVPEWWGGLLVPLPWVPWEILDEPCFKDPVEKGLLTWCRRISGHLEEIPDLSWERILNGQ